MQLYILLKQGGHPLHQLIGGWRGFKLRLAGAHRGHKKAGAIVHFSGLGSLNAFHQHFDIAVRHLHALHNSANGSDLVDIFRLGLVDRCVVLGCEKNLAVAVQRLFQSAHAGLAAHHERGHHVGKDDHVPDRHHRQLAQLGLFAGYGHIAPRGFGYSDQAPAAGLLARLMLRLYSGRGIEEMRGTGNKGTGNETASACVAPTASFPRFLVPLVPRSLVPCFTIPAFTCLPGPSGCPRRCKGHSRRRRMILSSSRRRRR